MSRESTNMLARAKTIESAMPRERATQQESTIGAERAKLDTGASDAEGGAGPVEGGAILGSEPGDHDPNQPLRPAMASLGMLQLYTASADQERMATAAIVRLTRGKK